MALWDNAPGVGPFRWTRARMAKQQELRFLGRKSGFDRATNSENNKYFQVK